MLNIYVPSNSNTLNSCITTTSGATITGTSVTWTNDATNSRYYNTTQNIYIYSVSDVNAARTANGD